MKHQVTQLMCCTEAQTVAGRLTQQRDKRLTIAPGAKSIQVTGCEWQAEYDYARTFHS
jgi:hypothetical protein